MKMLDRLVLLHRWGETGLLKIIFEISAHSFTFNHNLKYSVTYCSQQVQCQDSLSRGFIHCIIFSLMVWKGQKYPHSTPPTLHIIRIETFHGGTIINIVQLHFEY